MADIRYGFVRQSKSALSIQHQKMSLSLLIKKSSSSSLHRYTLTVTPSDIITTDDDLIDTPEEKRKCRFSHEHHASDASLFKQYSQSSCLFECKLRKALADPEKPSCLPWDFPHPEENITICNGYLENYSTI